MAPPPSRDARQGRALLLAAVALAGLVAVVALTEAPEESAPPGTPAWEPLERGLDADEVDALSLELDGGQALRAERVDGAWRCTVPTAFPCEERRISELVGALGRLEVGRALDGEHAAFGLERPRATVTLAGAGGQRLVLGIGDDAPVGGSTYLLLESGEVRPSRSPLGTTVPATLEDWRTPELLALSRADIEGVLVHERLADAEEEASLQQTLHLTHTDHGWWAGWAGGSPERAERRDAAALLDALLFVRADRFDLDRPTAPPDLRITVQGGESEEVLTIWVGESTWLVDAPLQGGVVRIRPDDLPRLLDRPLDAWLSEEIMPVHGITLERLRVRLADTVLEDQRTAGAWGDPRTEAVLRALDLSPADRSGSAPTPEGEPWGELLLDEGGRRVEAVDLHQLLDGGARVAVDRAGGPPFLVPASGLHALSEALGGVGSAQSP
jgi:hypothetical protein